MCVPSLSLRASSAVLPQRSAFSAANRGLAAAALILGLLRLSAPVAQAAKWDPIPAADLAAKASVGFPETDAEILLSEQSVENSAAGSMRTDQIMFFQFVITNRIRAKIYTAKGVQEQGKFVIDRGLMGGRVSQPEARVVKPDGTSIELSKADIFDGDEGKHEEAKISFVFPNLAPGDVVEYRWTTRLGFSGGYQMLYIQQRVPVREFRFSVGEMMRECYVSWVNCKDVEQTRKGDGIQVVVRNLAAFEPEMLMPAMSEYCAWLFMLPSTSMRDPAEQWPVNSALWAHEFEAATKPNDQIKAKATELIIGATTDDEKLRHLYEFCQSEIANFRWSNSPELVQKQKRFNESWARSRAAVVKSTLEERVGDSKTVNLLFAAFARGAGYQVRQIRCASKFFLSKVRVNMGWAFMNRQLVAVEVGGKWRVFDPGSYLVPYGMLDWADEGATAMRCGDERTVQFEPVPLSAAERTQQERKARLNLDAEGTLEGEIEESFTGHLAISHKQWSWKQSEAEATKRFQKEVTKRLPNAEVSAVTWTNLRSRELPLTVKYHVKVPGYAEQAGTRLVFAPSFFEAGEPVLFAEVERKYPISFPYARVEHDDIEIVLPEGYALDNPSAPAPVGDSAKLGAAYALKYTPKTRTFGYQRDFTLGGNGIITFKVESYPLLKRLFEQLHAADTHSILLKPKQIPATISALPVTGAEAK